MMLLHPAGAACCCMYADACCRCMHLVKVSSNILKFFQTCEKLYVKSAANHVQQK